MIIEFFNYALNGALLGLLYSLVAMGFVVIYRASKVFNMAVGEMLVVGAFLVWWAVQSRGMHPAMGIGVALAISVLIGLAIERLLFRRLIGESVFSMIMVTIGLLILMRGLVLLIWGPQERQSPAIIPLGPLIFGDLIVPRSLAAGGIIAVVAAFTPIQDLEKMVNIGTLFAFIIVCLAVMLLRIRRPEAQRRRTP